MHDRHHRHYGCRGREISADIVSGSENIDISFEGKFKGSRAVQEKLGVSPQTIFHNIGKFPSVTVCVDVDGRLVNVEADVEHVDDRTVIVRWNGHYDKGFIYII